MTDWQKLVAAQGLKSLLTKEWFDVCLLDSTAKTMGVMTGGQLRENLSVLHCIKYADMHPKLREMLPGKIAEYLQVTLNTSELEEIVDDFESGFRQESPQPRRNPLLRLIGK